MTSDRVVRDFCRVVLMTYAPSENIVERERIKYVPLEVTGTRRTTLS